MKNKKTLILLLIASLSFSIFSFAQNTSIAQEYKQKDGLFKINVSDGWRVLEKPGTIYILPPPPNGNGIVINFETAVDLETPEQIKSRISSNFEKIIKYKVMPSGGAVIENSEIVIDGVYARKLFHTVFLKQELMYFMSVAFVNKGFIFTIDYGDGSKEKVIEIINNIIETLKF